mgnify:FL=1
MKNRARTIAMSGLVMGLALGLSGCFGKAGSVSVTGGETEIIITAPRGYDTLAVAEGHCGSFKRKAVFNGRGESRGGDIITQFKCMVR